MLSLALLLASRGLGLVRESALAAAFGVTAVADVVVAMLTLPDLVSSTVAAGALGLVLLPWWARQAPDGQRASQRRVMGFLLMVGAALALWILLVPHQLAFLLAPGLGGEERALLESGLRWSACAVPASLAGALWYTRLQHERDVVGMYGMNIVHTGTVLAVLFPLTFVFHGADAVLWMGAGLLAAMGLRLVFLRWRLSRVRAREAVPLAPVTGLPTWKIWFWTLAATGFPVVLPVVARSLISDNGAGALATFNYAWKLVELPNLLAIQLVSTLAFPAIARAHAEGRNFHFALKQALVLAWTLACAAALALHVGSGPLSALLFGWGRMGPEHVAEVARWSAWGA
ncbi:MAG: virulence factor family protein, partial [Polaromonas sp.]|nr:virulence factor family protein [Polaromonas sp.]